MSGGLSTDNPGDDDDANADARRFGLDEETTAAIEARLAGGAHDGVWPENEPVVAAFLAVQTQWRTGLGRRGMVWLGLDYAGARAGLDAAGIAVDPELWAGLRIMEHEAARAMNGERP